MAPSTTRRERAWWGPSPHRDRIPSRFESETPTGSGDRLEDHQHQGLQLARPDHPRRRREAKLAPPAAVTSKPFLRLLSPFPIVRMAGWRMVAGARIEILGVRAPAGSRVLAVCRGKKCPVKKKIMAVSTKKPRPVRLKRFERFFPAGSVIEVFVRRTGSPRQVHPLHDPIKAPAVEAHGRLRGAQHHPCRDVPSGLINTHPGRRRSLPRGPAGLVCAVSAEQRGRQRRRGPASAGPRGPRGRARTAAEARRGQQAARARPQGASEQGQAPPGPGDRGAGAGPSA